MSTTIPQPLALALPLIAAGLAAWLTTDKLSQLVNGLIIAFFFVLALVLAILTSGLPLTSLSVSIVIAYSAGIFALLKPLMDYLSLKVPSPLAALAPARSVDAVPVALAAQGTVTAAMTLPTGKQFIPGPGALPDNGAPLQTPISDRTPRLTDGPPPTNG